MQYKFKKQPKIKQPVGRKCSVCIHEKAAEINSRIARGDSFRRISSQFGMADRSVSRHAENCLSLEVSALIKEKKIHGAINFNSEIEKQFYFAKELITASREYLSDEYGNITLVPRSTEIEVMYDDFSDLNNQGEPKKKTATLSALLIRAEAGNIKPLKITAKHVDIRQFALNAISTGSDVLDKVAKVQGIYQKERNNNQDVELADRYLKLADEWVSRGDFKTQSEALNFMIEKDPTLTGKFSHLLTSEALN